MKKRGYNSRIMKTAIIFLTAVLAISFISAATGIVTPYWTGTGGSPDNLLKLAPGESRVILLTLENTGNESETFNATIDKPLLASFVNNPPYVVSAGNLNATVGIKVSVPADAVVGTPYKVSISFIQVSSAKGGQVQVTEGLTSQLPILVVGKTESSLYTPPQGSNLILWIVLAIVVLAVIIFIVHRKRGKK